MSKKAPSLFFVVVVVFAMTAESSAQKLSESAQRKLASAVAGIPGAKAEPITPRSIRPTPLLFSSSVPSSRSSIQGNPGGLPGIDSVPNFTRAFRSQGQTWPYTMMGNDPALGHRTRIPARIIAVSLELQNADLATTTKVPIAPFERLALNSPNFEESDYSTGEDIQFADAVQRAEFFHVMKESWHTELRPARIVEHVTIFVPRTIKVPSVDKNGNPVEVDVRTYLSGQADDGSTFVLLLDTFFDQAFFDTVANAIGAGDLTTDALNIVLLPNTFLFSLEEGSSGNLVRGFHTFLFDDSVTPMPIWVTAFASWTSPGLFGAGIEDVTGLSHEISESLNNPFLINSVPAWQFPGIPGSCQADLEVGDPIEALDNQSVPIRIERGRRSFTYHPQTEALLQWFEDAVPSDAIHRAYSYPDTTALTGPAVFFGQLSCPTGP
jgi:hypothetical protein